MTIWVNACRLRCRSIPKKRNSRLGHGPEFELTGPCSFAVSRQPPSGEVPAPIIYNNKNDSR